MSILFQALEAHILGFIKGGERELGVVVWQTGFYAKTH
jgi:hypothetical protein